MTRLRVWASKAAIIWALAGITYLALRAIARVCFVSFCRDVREIWRM